GRPKPPRLVKLANCNSICPSIVKQFVNTLSYSCLLSSFPPSNLSFKGKPTAVERITEDHFCIKAWNSCANEAHEHIRGSIQSHARRTLPTSANQISTRHRL
ncbi:unnamed protein product, partial [Ectocarpus sp. 8 AP-2014]